MRTIDELIDGLGGTNSVASRLGVEPNTVSSWKRRRSVPSGYWASLVRIGADLGRADVTFEALASLHERRAEPVEARA